MGLFHFEELSWENAKSIENDMMSPVSPQDSPWTETDYVSSQAVEEAMR
jgi:hypothetical protein